MDNWIVRNWLILAVTSLITGFWIAFTEDFVKDKASLFFILAMLFGYIWLKKKRKL
jgi:hypothetical protein